MITESMALANQKTLRWILSLLLLSLFCPGPAFAVEAPSGTSDLVAVVYPGTVTEPGTPYPGTVQSPPPQPSTAPAPVEDPPSPGLAVLCSILPGAGHLYLGELDEAAYYAAPFGAMVFFGLAGMDTLYGISTFVWWEVYLYSMFDAYRDARLLGGNAGYTHPITSKGFWAHLTAPYHFSNLFTGYALLTLAETALTLTLALVLTPATFSIDDPDGELTGMSFGAKLGLSLVLLAGGYLFFTPVAAAEEGFFRGMVHGSLKEGTPTPVALLLSSTIFALVHIPQVLPSNTDEAVVQDEQAQVDEDPLANIIALRFISGFTGGLLFGLLYELEGGELDHAITMHVLGNSVLIASAPFLAGRLASPLEVSFSIPF